MAAIGILNPKAEYARTNEAFMVNLSAARGLQDIMKANLGPKGTMKMLVSGAGDIKITKDGSELLTNMQIMHPTASLIARTSTSMDSITGDGTTSTILLIGELLKKADTFMSDGIHPRMISKGLSLGREHVLQILDSMKIPFSFDNEVLHQIARVALRSKLPEQIADALVDVCVDAVMSIYNAEGNNVDLDMIEIMVMQHKQQIDTRLIKGLVLDHGSRHPDMPKSVSNASILTCNVSLEYEKTEVNSGFFYKSAEERDMFVKAERDFVDARVRKIIELKKNVCDGKSKSFVVINQKGIDPLSLEMLAKEGIIALRRAKRRNMERLMLACGGTAVNSLDELTEDCLGTAGQVYEHVLGETKYTFVVDCVNPKSVTVLVHGPATYATKQIEEAVKDAFKMMKNAFEDKCILPGGGAVELALNKSLVKYMEDVEGKKRLGIKVLAESLLAIPQALAINSGFDPVETLSLLDYEVVHEKYPNIGLNISTGRPTSTPDHGIFDNYCVKRQSIISAIVIASNILLVDDIMRAGLTSLKGLMEQALADDKILHQNKLASSLRKYSCLMALAHKKYLEDMKHRLEQKPCTVNCKMLVRSISREIHSKLIPLFVKHQVCRHLDEINDFLNEHKWARKDLRLDLLDLFNVVKDVKENHEGHVRVQYAKFRKRFDEVQFKVRHPPKIEMLPEYDEKLLKFRNGEKSIEQTILCPGNPKNWPVALERRCAALHNTPLLQYSSAGIRVHGSVHGEMDIPGILADLNLLRNQLENARNRLREKIANQNIEVVNWALDTVSILLKMDGAWLAACSGLKNLLTDLNVKIESDSENIRSLVQQILSVTLPILRKCKLWIKIDELSDVAMMKKTDKLDVSPDEMMVQTKNLLNKISGGC